METIQYYNIEIYRKPKKYSFSEDLFEVKQVEILAQNEKYIVLNDAFFTKIEQKNSKQSVVYSVLGRPSITFKNCLGEQGIFYRLYSTQKKRISTIEASIKSETKDKYSWLFSDELDLSILSGVKK